MVDPRATKVPLLNIKTSIKTTKLQSVSAFRTPAKKFGVSGTFSETLEGGNSGFALIQINIGIVTAVIT